MKKTVISLFLVVLFAMTCFSGAFATDSLAVSPEEHNVMLTGNSSNFGTFQSDGSTESTISGNEMVWLRSVSGNTATWFGIDNSDGVFEEGSRLSVRWYSQKENPAEWDKIRRSMDNDSMKFENEDDLMLFDVTVIKPDGEEYTIFPQSVPIYVELGDDWDDENIEARFIDEGEDENIRIERLFLKDPTDQKGKFAKLTLNHFGEPMALGEKFDDFGVGTSFMQQTSLWVSLALLEAIVIVVLLILLIAKRKKKTEV